jgi:hypothetical protein
MAVGMLVNVFGIVYDRSGVGQEASGDQHSAKTCLTPLVQFLNLVRAGKDSHHDPPHITELLRTFSQTGNRVRASDAQRSLQLFGGETASAKLCVFGHYSILDGQPRGSASTICADCGVGDLAALAFKLTTSGVDGHTLLVELRVETIVSSDEFLACFGVMRDKLLSCRSQLLALLDD